MRTSKKKSIITICITAALFLIAGNSHLLPRISHNGSGTGYEDGDELGGTASLAAANTSIETYIIYGAGYYLQGQSSIQALLNLVEMQDVKNMDTYTIRKKVDSTLYYIGNADFIYEMLVWTAEATPYNKEVISRLKSFDYEGYRIQNRLNSEIFKKLSGYLAMGDITGTFKYTLSKVKAMEALLNDILTELTVNGKSRLDLYWQLNELCAETSLFGSYAARVFSKINGE